MVIQLDLSKQDYKVFDTDEESNILHLKNKNFIFGKNGTGKSTLCEMIKSQFNDAYDVQIFSGFQNVTEDEKLNAIVLGKENIDAKKRLQPLENMLKSLRVSENELKNSLKSLKWDDIYAEQGIVKHSLYKNKEEVEKQYNNKKNEIDEFYREKAKELKEYINPQITKTSYNKNDFINDISMSKVLGENEIDKYTKTLSEASKSKVKNNFGVKNIALGKLVDEINDILIHKVKEVTFIKEIKEDPDRKEFAQRGLELHEAGENCSFCGNQIKKDRITKLESFISISAVQELEEKINNQFEEIQHFINQIDEIKVINKNNFNSNFHDNIDEINNRITINKKEYQDFLKTIIERLNEKSRSMFKTIEKITIRFPNNFSEVKDKITNLIDRQNEWTSNIELKKNETKAALRLHYVAIKLLEKEQYKERWQGYIIEKHDFTTLESQIDSLEIKKSDEIKKIQGTDDQLEINTLAYVKAEIIKCEEEKQDILRDTKSTHLLVEIINKKLKNSGKKNLELVLVKDENDIEHYKVKNDDDVRSIERVSTGEKNIIAFLYFLESLSDVERKSDKNKIVIFDDPMNSNDDTMQYLIITEMQKLYTNKYRDKLDLQKDYFVCLTHNAHFYLNVQPQGNFKEEKIIDGKKKKISKYDKNNFYRIESGKFNHILSQNDDFHTHYDSLWIELKELYVNDLLNSILNSMRRIIETYTKFNKKNPIKFYENKEEHKKLFDVNSHSIDDHSMEMIGKSKIELLEMFKNLFESNDAIEHFNTHWD